MKSRGWAANRYSHHRKSTCERCGTHANLLVHHRDENLENNELDNLETLCKRCHQIEHKCWLNLNNKGKPSWNRSPDSICKACGKEFHRPAYQVGAGFCSRSCAVRFRNKLPVSHC